jgi:multiple sugar transport system permease protein
VVILLASLNNVPRDLYEAAELDGAGWWARLWHVTLPGVSGTVYFLVIVDTINALQSFTEAYTAFFGAANSSYSNDAALFYVIYLFQQAFQFFHMGYASAMAVLLFVVIAVVTAAQVWLGRRFVHYGGES